MVVENSRKKEQEIQLLRDRRILEVFECNTENVTFSLKKTVTSWKMVNRGVT